MTQSASDPVVTFRQEIAAELGKEFGLEDGTPDPAFDVPAELLKLPEVFRLDFDPRWEVGNAPPGRDDLRILSIFESDQPMDFRVYVMPVAPTTEPKAFLRYTLSRIGATGAVEKMVRETFLTEVVDEYAAMLTGGEDEEDEDDQPDGAAPAAGAQVSS